MLKDKLTWLRSRVFLLCITIINYSVHYIIILYSFLTQKLERNFTKTF